MRHRDLFVLVKGELGSVYRVPVLVHLLHQQAVLHVGDIEVHGEDAAQLGIRFCGLGIYAACVIFGRLGKAIHLCVVVADGVLGVILVFQEVVVSLYVPRKVLDLHLVGAVAPELEDVRTRLGRP